MCACRVIHQINFDFVKIVAFSRISDWLDFAAMTSWNLSTSNSRNDHAWSDLLHFPITIPRRFPDWSIVRVHDTFVCEKFPIIASLFARWRRSISSRVPIPIRLHVSEPRDKPDNLSIMGRNDGLSNITLRFGADAVCPKMVLLRKIWKSNFLTPEFL